MVGYDVDRHAPRVPAGLDLDRQAALKLITVMDEGFGDGLHIREGASMKKLFTFCETLSSPVQNRLWLIN
ncbi:MAG: hypothetical protein OXF73_13450, partial [Gammaproteobacteria bacterium]|nr:hypothetical protein [Gammaproteobacteria bacterium]